MFQSEGESTLKPQPELPDFVRDLEIMKSLTQMDEMDEQVIEEEPDATQP